ncbi:MAG: choice-of-anchor C family protein [Phycisphaerales bacterium]
MRKIAFVMLFTIMPFSVADADLITNGSFELGIGWQDNVPLGSTGITGWTVTRANIDLVEWYWQPSDGERSLDLNGSPGVGGIAQAFATSPGQLYQVLFDQAANPDLGARVSHMGVQAAGQSAEYVFDCTGRTLDDMGWVTQTWQFTAVDTTTTLEFYSLDIGDAWKGPALDNVIVTAISPVPIPGAVALGALGLGAAGMRLRRHV